MTVDEAKEYFVKSSLCYENSLLDRCDGCDGCIFEVDPSNFCKRPLGKWVSYWQKNNKLPICVCM